MFRNNECHLRLLAYNMVLLRVNRRATFVVVDVELVSSVELASGRVKQSAALNRRITLMKLTACAHRQASSVGGVSCITCVFPHHETVHA